MNDAAVTKIWYRLKALEGLVNELAGKMVKMEGQIRARLKEETEARENALTNAYDEGYSMALAGDDD